MKEKPNATFICQVCGHNDQECIDTKVTVSGGKHHRFQCKGCGAETVIKYGSGIDMLAEEGDAEDDRK